jgi:YD repeat-containing protein
VRYLIYKRPSADSEICLNYNPRGKLISKEKRVFDSNARVVKELIYNSSGGLKGAREYLYKNDFFKPVKIIKKFKQSVQKQQYTYNSSGNVIREVRYTDGQPDLDIVYEYDLNNNMVVFKGFKGGKPEGSKHFYYRNDNGKLVDFFLLRGPDGDIIEKGEFTYKFYN